MNTRRFIIIMISIIYTSQYLHSQSTNEEERDEHQILYSINLGYSLLLTYNKDDYSENLTEHYKDLKNGINTGLSVSYKLSNRIWLGGAFQFSHSSSKKDFKHLTTEYYGKDIVDYGGSAYGGYGYGGYGGGYYSYSTIDENINTSYLSSYLNYFIMSKNNQLISVGSGIGIVRYDEDYKYNDSNFKTKGYTIGLSPQANYHFLINKNLSVDFKLNIFICYLKKFTSDSNYYGKVKHNLDFGELYNLSRIDFSIGLNLWK